MAREAEVALAELEVLAPGTVAEALAAAEGEGFAVELEDLERVRESLAGDVLHAVVM